MNYKDLEARAEAGDVDAQLEFVRYLTRCSDEPDYELREIFLCYRAIGQGSLEAKYLLSRILKYLTVYDEYGYHVSPESCSAEAVYWLTEAAKGGHVEAQLELKQLLR